MANDWADLDQSWAGRTTPEWFRDAKLGIFVHWGLFSVPGWAPLTGSFENAEKMGWEYWFANCPYAEWYENSMRIAGSPTALHHASIWNDQPYSAFDRIFAEQIATWDPHPWAELFTEAGARYVVPTSKHHDGYCLWPTDVANPKRPAYHSTRDLIGELGRAVRASKMRYGLYYSGGLDWSWNPAVCRVQSDVFSTFPQSSEFVAYVDAHWRELIDRYEPDILWNDIGTPRDQNLSRLFRDYWDRVPDGAINSRFRQRDETGAITFETPFDFTTPEYTSESGISDIPFESCRGIGYSFGYNQAEDETAFIPSRDLIHHFIDVVSKNGNLLLNVGPRASGSIPEVQATRLRELGRWLRVNGEAIYGTRPWSIAAGMTGSGDQIRFTTRNDSLLAIVLNDPRPGRLALDNIHPADSAIISVLGHSAPLPWERSTNGIMIDLPSIESGGPAYVLRINPIPISI